VPKSALFRRTGGIANQTLYQTHDSHAVLVEALMTKLLLLLRT